MNGRSACAMTWAACGYWALAFVVVGLILVATAGTLWTAGRHSNEVALLLAAAIACFANYRKNCTYHCRLTGPLFLAAGVILILETRGVRLIPESWLWAIVITGTCLAFGLEAWHARRAVAERC